MDLAPAFVARSRHYLREEYLVKLRKAVAALPPDRLWWRPDESSNSVGNLLLHLTGNVGQWIVAGVSGAPLARDRAGEFAAREGGDARELLDGLDAALREADAVLSSLTAAKLVERRTIQGREVSVLDAVYHVVEHFAMHTGQIIMLVKMHAPGAVRFYEDAGGLARPLWK